MSSGGGKQGQLSAFGREIPRETTPALKVTVKPLIHTTAGTIEFRLFIYSFIFLVLASPAGFKPRQRHPARQKPNALPTSHPGAQSQVLIRALSPTGIALARTDRYRQVSRECRLETSR